MAAAVFTVTLTVATSAFLLRDSHKEPPAFPALPQFQSATAALSAFAVATAKIGDPAPSKTVLHRRDLDVVIDGCRVTAIRSQSWTTAAGRGKSAPGRLLIELVEPPAAGCGATGPYPKTLFDGETADQSAEWQRLAGGYPQYDLPRRTRPDWVGQTLGLTQTWRELEPNTQGLERRLAKLCANFRMLDCTAVRWTTLVELLASAETSQPQRHAALELAAAGAGNVVLVSEVSTDLTGRPGVTLRVPFVAGSETGFDSATVLMNAEITFDVATGALLQRAVRTAEGRSDTTVYLAMGRLA